MAMLLNCDVEEYDASKKHAESRTTQRSSRRKARDRRFKSEVT